MMMFDRMLRSGVWLRRRKKWLPWAFITSVLFALMITPPFTIIKNTPTLTTMAILVALAGFAVRYFAMQTKSLILTDIVQAKGVFSIVRFPVYLANIIIMLSLTIYVGIVWYMVFVALIAWIIAEKIILNEENALLNKYGEVFLQWTKHTRCVIPNIFNWEKSQYKVGVREVVRTQSKYLMLTVAGFGAINLLKNIMIDFSFHIGMTWVVAFVITLVLYLFSQIGHKADS